MMEREFAPLTLRLGGGDEYTPEQLAAINVQLMAMLPQDFDNSYRLMSEDMGGGFSQEIRVYWRSNSTQYAYLYALLHEREDGLLVLRWEFNTMADRILEWVQ